MENILEKIYKAGLKFLVPLTPEETYATIVDEAVKLVGAEWGSILLAQDGELKRVYGSSPVAYQTRNRKKGNTYKAFVNKKTIIVPISQLKRYHRQLYNLGIKWIIFIPLSYKDKAIGVLTINAKKEEKFNQRELNILNLFGSLATLAIRKTQLYDETHRALETRDIFISMAAHELRTPITTIHGYVQLLHRKLKGNDGSESRWVEELMWETIRLTNLVNELLEASRIKTGLLEYNWQGRHLRDIISRALKNFSFVYPNHQVEFVDKLDSQSDLVVGDDDKLLQVILNILENAAKYSTGDKNIQMSLQKKSGRFFIKIKDRGTGIKKGDLPKVFEGFYRGSHYPEGMGIGLFLVKNIMSQHHGSVQIKSKVGKGTLVQLELPATKI